MKQSSKIGKSMMKSSIVVNEKSYIGPITRNYKRNGFGHQDFDNGDTYDGNFKDDQFEGQGVYYYKNGNYYEGNFSKGVKQGKGVFRVKHGDDQYDVYTGYFKNGLKEGKFTVTYINGDVFVGQYVKDKKSYGTLTYSSGAQYIGSFADNKFEGKGTFQKAGQFKYTGVFKENKRQGWGREQQGYNYIACPFEGDIPAGWGKIYYDGKRFKGVIYPKTPSHATENHDESVKPVEIAHNYQQSATPQPMLPPADHPSLPGGAENVNGEENA